MRRPPACSGPRSGHKHPANHPKPGSISPNRQDRSRRPVYRPGVAAASSGSPCDNPPRPARSPAARYAAPGVPQSLRPPGAALQRSSSASCPAPECTKFPGQFQQKSGRRAHSPQKGYLAFTHSARLVSRPINSAVYLPRAGVSAGGPSVIGGKCAHRGLPAQDAL